MMRKKEKQKKAYELNHSHSLQKIVSK